MPLVFNTRWTKLKKIKKNYLKWSILQQSSILESSSKQAKSLGMSLIMCLVSFILELNMLLTDLIEFSKLANTSFASTFGFISNSGVCTVVAGYIKEPKEFADFVGFGVVRESVSVVSAKITNIISL